MRRRNLILPISIIAIVSAMVIYGAATGSIGFITGTGSSMEPTITQNDVMIVVPVNPEFLRVGDIITYRREVDGGNKVIFVTHRIIVIDDGLIKTKGDAMSEADEYVVRTSDVKVKVVGRIPFAALLIRFVHTTIGYILFILVPASLLIGMEIKKKLRASKHSRSNTRRR
ncbi:signal peptidase I [candidate division WOR-3 bacterium]|nr:signal peptidase I [candidate division WOR-3 bacterium]